MFLCVLLLWLKRTVEPIGAKRDIATGLRVPADPRRLHTTDTRRRRASVVYRLLSFDSLFVLLLLSPFSVDMVFASAAEVLVGYAANVR